MILRVTRDFLVTGMFTTPVGEDIEPGAETGGAHKCGRLYLPRRAESTHGEGYQLGRSLSRESTYYREKPERTVFRVDEQLWFRYVAAVGRILNDEFGTRAMGE